MGKESMFGMMGILIMVSLKMISLMGMGSSDGRMAGFIKGCGLIIKCMVMASIFGLMETSMW